MELKNSDTAVGSEMPFVRTANLLGSSSRFFSAPTRGARPPRPVRGRGDVAGPTACIPEDGDERPCIVMHTIGRSR